ncbi:hypothetical protein NC981_23830 [Leptolyngbya sp. DQ-M1]|uniref:hypothetical protein n=1 Tax=Leptolyngbya sp. DQ-M1 TaxID=2933920 RepID=UPI003299919F
MIAAPEPSIVTGSGAAVGVEVMRARAAIGENGIALRLKSTRVILTDPLAEVVLSPKKMKFGKLWGIPSGE